MCTASIAWALKRYVARAGLDPTRISIHTFRHTAARVHYTIRPDVRAVGRLLRHRSLHTTTIYLEELFSTDDPVAERMMEAYGNL